MTQSADNYIPTKVKRQFERQAMTVWVIALVLVLFWVILILSAPLFRSADVEHVSLQLYSFFSYICHQIPERSLHFAGHQLGVCSRCFGIYFGILFGFIVYPFWRKIDDIEPMPRIWLFLSLIPIGVDWSLTAFGIWDNTHFSRFLTGTILGAACAIYIVPSIVETVRNFTIRSLSQNRER